MALTRAEVLKFKIECSIIEPFAKRKVESVRVRLRSLEDKRLVPDLKKEIVFNIQLSYRCNTALAEEMEFLKTLPLLAVDAGFLVYYKLHNVRRTGGFRSFGKTTKYTVDFFASLDCLPGYIERREPTSWDPLTDELADPPKRDPKWL